MLDTSQAERKTRTPAFWCAQYKFDTRLKASNDGRRGLGSQLGMRKKMPDLWKRAVHNFWSSSCCYWQKISSEDHPHIFTPVSLGFNPPLQWTQFTFISLIFYSLSALFLQCPAWKRCRVSGTLLQKLSMIVTWEWWICSVGLSIVAQEFQINWGKGF